MSEGGKKSVLEKGGTYAAAMGAILTLIFLLFPNLKPQPKDHLNQEVLQQVQHSVAGREPSQPPSSSPHPQPPPGDIILGTWQQYGFDPTTSQWEYLGTFIVAKADGAYTMSAREQRDAREILNSIGIFDVRSNGTSWSFNSNWGSGRVGNFLLQRVSDTQFDGTISTGERVIGTTRWVKVQ